MKMMFLDSFGLGHPYAPARKCAGFDPFSLAAPIANGVFGFLGAAQQNKYTKQQMKLQSRLNREEMVHSSALQKDQQEWMMNNMYGKNVSGMMNAGLNPATANGVSPATPSGGSPSSGSSGPSAGMPNFGDIGGSVRDALTFKADLDIKKAEKDNLVADKELKESQATNTDADTVIKQWQGSPRYQQLVENGLSANAAKAWAETGLSEAETFKCMSDIQKIGKEMGLMDEQINVLQEQAAKLRSDVDVNMSQVELNRSIKKAQEAAAVELYSRAKLNKANASYLGALTKTEDALRNEKKVNIRNDSLLKGQNIKLTSTEEKIKSYMLDTMDNIDPDSVEGQIWSRLDRLGSVAGQVLGAAAQVYGAGKIGKGIGMQDHSRYVANQTVNIHKP